jgi:hypothetical protein
MFLRAMIQEWHYNVHSENILWHAAWDNESTYLLGPTLMTVTSHILI